MKKADSASHRLSELQAEAMYQIGAIGDDIDAGRISLEEGSKKADALALELGVRSAPLIEERERELRWRQIRSRLLTGAALVGGVCAVLALIALSAGPAP